MQQSIVWGNSDDVQFALLARDVANDYKLKLAQQTGAIKIVAETDAKSEIPLWRLLAERALCVNTTAGGNASLMSFAKLSFIQH